MSGILSSCCPFLTNAAREGRGSPPYTTEDMRLRLHNWTNSLSGSTQIPRPIKASTEEKPGLPELSTESSAITFVKSETSMDQEEDEGECKVILSPREIFTKLDQAAAAAIAADFHPIPYGDWESEKGLEEEEVTLLQVKPAGDDELNVACLERKAAKTVLPLGPPVDHHNYELSSALPFKGRPAPHPSSLPNIPEQPPEPAPMSVSNTSTFPTSKDASEDNSRPSTSTEQEPSTSTEQEPSASTEQEPSTSTEEPSTSGNQSQAAPDTSPDISDDPCTEPSSSSLRPKFPLLPEDPTQPSQSSELLDAISSLSAARNDGKTRRSRRTNTRAPTPWSATEADDDDDATPERLGEEEQLERVSSSGSSSPFESVAGTEDSSYHTLPTASNSREQADVLDNRSSELVLAEPTSAASAVAAAAERIMAGAALEAAEMFDASEGTNTETTAGATETGMTEDTEMETTEETSPPNETEADSASGAQPGSEATSDSSGGQSSGSATATSGATSTSPGDATAAGDQAPAITISDDVSLRYFCGAFQPVDHHMTRYAGLEPPAPAPGPQAVPSGRSDSAVTPQAEDAAGRGRNAASDSGLELGHRSASPLPPAGDDSGVQLEAKRPSTDLPM